MMMKKNLFLAALAIVALASCTDSEFVGDNSPTNPNTGPGAEKAIVFNSGAKTVTRADHLGADAADLLGGKFIVEGFKGDGSAMDEVFNNYYVKWTANTAGKTESNTSDWEYVGTTVAKPSTLPTGATQSIKYWDYSTDQYDFAAYSTGKLTASKIKDPDYASALSEGEVKISTITKADPYAGPTYTLTGDIAGLKECYISDMVTAYKADKTPSQPKYQQEINLTFRNIASKVRVALYETVPGYSVKDVKFYTSNSSPDFGKASATTATLFTTGATAADKFFTAGTATVSFPTIGSSNIDKTDYNKAHVSFTATSDATSMSFGDLNKVKKEYHEITTDALDFIGRTLATASFAGIADPWYTTVLPNENGTVLELRIDYTLMATDGSGELIKVNGATAYVPAVYAAWKSNYAYTYIFKISDNTNGWTDPSGANPAGLYPITFDAVVVDNDEHTQSTITTVSTPSITTYQKGHVYNVDNTDPYTDEYDASVGAIYFMIQDETNLKHDLYYQAALYEIDATGATTTVSEATVLDALNIYSISGTNIVGRNGITLKPVGTTLVTEIAADDAVDGNAIPVTLKVDLSSEPTGWPTGYYKDPACTVDATTFAAGIYYQKYTAAKFTPTSGKVYAYTYLVSDNDDTYIYSAESTSTKPTDWLTADTWYKDPNGAEAVADENWAADKYFYKKYTNHNKVFAIKVIKVQ